MDLVPKVKPIMTTKTFCENIEYNHRIIKSDISKFLHQTGFSSVPFTWIQAIDNILFTTWPGLSSYLILTDIPKSMETSKGHLQQIKQNILSTKPKPTTQQSKPCTITAPTA